MSQVNLIRYGTSWPGNFLGYQVSQAPRRFQPQFCLQQSTAIVILAVCLETITLRKMRPDQGPMGAFAQGLGTHGGETGLHGLAISVRCSEPIAHSFEGVESQLVISLPVQYHPILFVPIGQDICRQERQCFHIEDVLTGISGVKHAVGGCYRILQVYDYLRGEAEPPGRSNNKLIAASLHPPYG